MAIASLQHRIALRSMRVLLGAICLLCLAELSWAAEALRVSVVLSDSNAPYQTFAKSFQQNLPAGIHVHVLERPEDFSGDAQDTDLVVTVGVKAAELVSANTRLPILAAMIPSSKYAELSEKHARPLSAIFIDQPWARQISLLQAALPGHHKVSVLHSSDTRTDITGLRKKLTERGYKPVFKALRSNATLYADLEEAMENSDVLFAIPDNAIYNSGNIRNILLSTYRRRIPLIGLSQAYVNAGALYAIFSTPEQLAAQSSKAAVAFAKSAKLSEPQYPELYTIAVNQEVARTLGLNISSAELLHMQVEQASGGTR
ncbi:MAG: hypothetical protein HYZ46_02410 [Nitrosomonadales bacterium]|nr:hypothetical protein [Nitrosomonadales bacterium]